MCLILPECQGSFEKLCVLYKQNFCRERQTLVSPLNPPRSYYQSEAENHTKVTNNVVYELDSLFAKSTKVGFPIITTSKCIMFTNLCRMSSSSHVLGPYGLLDAIHLLLIPFPIAGCIFFGFFQSRLQGLNSLSCSPKSFLQLWKLTTKICIITYQLQEESICLPIIFYCFTSYHGQINLREGGVYLFVDFCELFQVVLKKGDLLLLCSTSPCVIRVHFCALQIKYPVKTQGWPEQRTVQGQ